MSGTTVQTSLKRLDEFDATTLEAGFADLAERAADLIDAENDVDAWRFERSVDARFEGQLFELNLPIAAGEAPSVAKIEMMFRATHRETYGYDLTGAHGSVG